MSDGNTDMNNFINYLDNYKKMKNVSIFDMYNILYSINYDFYSNNYDNPNYAGNLISNRTKNKNKNKKQSILDFLSLDGLEKVNLQEFTETTLEPKSLEPNIEKMKVHIDVEIKCLKDLIRIIDKYEYKENEEYNIDLKSLTNIKEELIELNNMIGMETLKNSILSQLLYFIQELHIEKKNKGGKVEITSEFKHTVICGPPGTGKTEISKIIGRMYSKIGILKSNIFKKVTRNDLIAGYLGQTAIKTKNIINECLGGVLFIDEAYSLAGQNDLDNYSKECLDTICEALSDHKNDLMVIIAGYEDELENTFFAANRGLESRFIWRFKIDKYSPKELTNIFIKKIKETDWEFSEGFEPSDKWFEKNKENFRNYGRDMELLFTYTKICHSKRIYGKPIEQRKKINLNDLDGGFEMLKNNKKQINMRNPILDSLYL